MLCKVPVLVLCTLASAPLRADLVGPPPDMPQARVVKDLLADFGEADCANASVAEVNPKARSGGAVMPAVFLHPGGPDDAVAAFPVLSVPQVAPGSRALLVFRPAMSDGIDWGGSKEPNGVRFRVVVEGETLYEEHLQAPGWHWRCVELTRWAGRSVRLALRTNAVESNAAYDWALFGRPRVVVVQPEEGGRESAGSPGLLVAKVECEAEAQVRLRCGMTSDTAQLPAGESWLPLGVNAFAEPTLEVLSGKAELSGCVFAPWTYRVQVGDAALTSPLVTARRGFRARVMLRNVGEGRYPGGEDARFGLASGEQEAVKTPALDPGQELALVGPGFSVARAGHTHIELALGDYTANVPVTVLPVEPALPSEHPVGAKCTARRATEGVLGLAANPWSRVVVVRSGSGEAYGIAQTWDGGHWVRAGTLYPLARLVVADREGKRLELPVTVSGARCEGDGLLIEGYAGDWPLQITLAPGADAPRIAATWRVTAPQASRLLLFTGPTLLAGDRSFGAHKEFALFPGLEYLEGDEPSSSTRDLAPPLNDRSVPAPWKIATPLMAVQGRGCLAGLLWDEAQCWTDGQPYPAARFRAPARDAGEEYHHLSLSAPAVGEWVPENQTEAARPYPVRVGQKLTLSAQLLLVHQSGRGVDGSARPSHRGDLVLRAMDQWFDAFGLLQPSAQPRTEADQRDLSRVAFLETLWSQEPPGWPSFKGQALGTDTEPLVTLGLDLALGMDGEAAAEVRARMERVADYALGKAGVGALLSGNRVILPYQYGHLAEALRYYRQMGEGMLASRENGRWVWRPGDVEHEALGVPGTATLGQAAYPSLVALRAARFTGDSDLARRALEAARQMDEYEVPRGASMWECPQYQPDIFAAALAIKAYCEAYRLSGDQAHLEHARYWARTGLPFLYTWQMPGLTGMLYNSIGVIGSTYFTHSWIGRPVVWMGLDYAYALQDLAALDDSFPWLTVAQGIVNSAMHQQQTEGENRGLYPDSWEMATNSPNAPFLNPGLIMVNEWRLRGLSAEVRHAWLGDREDRVSLNAGVDIAAPRGSFSGGSVAFGLRGRPAQQAYASLAPVPEPRAVRGCGDRADDGAALSARACGWQYDPELRALIVKADISAGPASIEVCW